VTTDTELTQWRRQWRGEPPESASRAEEAERLRQHVLRGTRRAKLSLIAPISVTVGVGGGMTLLALRGEHPLHLALAIETWVFIAVIWAGCLWIARGTWRPLADTTAAFVDISIRRRIANRRGATFGLCLYVFQLLIMKLIVGRMTSASLVDSLTSPHMIMFGWIGLPIICVAFYRFRRRQRAELARLLELERQLQAD
jgi:hypothetical protein